MNWADEASILKKSERAMVAPDLAAVVSTSSTVRRRSRMEEINELLSTISLYLDESPSSESYTPASMEEIMDRLVQGSPRAEGC